MISIIVPIYNMENKLSRCVDSVLRQTYGNFELLLIDDGSTDSSLKLCEEYQRKDNRIKVFHKENGGVSSARNLGLKVAAGDYISFIDPDDWVEDNYLEVLYNCLVERKADITYCLPNDCNAIADGEIVEYPNPAKYFADKHFNCPVWGGLFSRKILQGIYFDEKIFVGEDSLFNATALRNSHVVFRVNLGLYHYVTYASSALHGKFSLKKLSDLTAWRKIIDLYNGQKLKQDSAKAHYGMRCYSFICTYYFDKIFKQDYYKSVLKEYRANYKNVIRFENNFFKRFAYKLFYCVPRIYIHLFGNRYAERKRGGKEYE